MRTTYRWDRDMECLVEVRSNSNYYDDTPKGPNVISDTMGSNVNGLRAMYRTDKKHFDSKSQYRADVRARGLAEVGNDRIASTREKPTVRQYEQRVADTFSQIEGNYNGVADRLRNERR